MLREGDKSYNVSVHYETVDGTAKAGVDYAAASGELAFAGSIDEIEIPIDLIAGDTTENRTFNVRLTELHGGGPEELCRFTTREISSPPPPLSPHGSSSTGAWTSAGPAAASARSR